MATNADTILNAEDATTVDTTATDTATADNDTSKLADTTTTATTAAANDDWRIRAAGGDKTLAGFLARIPSEKALIEKVKQQEDDLKQGKYIKPLPENPTDAEKAEYRRLTGVPEKADDYLADLPSNIVVGEDDKPFLDIFAAQMLEAGAPKGVAAAAIDAYYKIVEDQSAAQAQAEAEFKDAGIEALREEFGPDYKRNLNAVSSFIGTLPEAVSTAFIGGRNAAGLPLGSDPEVIKWLASIALEKNPLSTVVPGTGASQVASLNSEIATLETMMGDKGSEYWKGPKAEANRARYLELIEAREKLKGA